MRLCCGCVVRDNALAVAARGNSGQAPGRGTFRRGVECLVVWYSRLVATEGTERWFGPGHQHRDEAITEAERRLAAARQQDAIRTAQEFTAIGLPTFDATALADLLGQDLPALDAAALTRLHTHFQTLGAGGERWVADGIGRVAANPDGGVQACPFCGQDLAGSTLIEAYRAYFSAEYAALDQRVSAMISDVQRAHGAAVFAAFERSVRMRASASASGPALQCTACRVEHRGYLAGLAGRERRRRGGSSCEESIAAISNDAAGAPGGQAHAFEQHRHTIDGLSASLLAVNAAIPTIRERAAAGNVAAIEADIRDLSAIRARFEVMPTPLLIQHSTGSRWFDVEGWVFRAATRVSQNSNRGPWSGRWRRVPTSLRPRCSDRGQRPGPNRLSDRT